LRRTGSKERLILHCSPDLAPCDSFLFGYIKDRLKGQSFDDGKELLRAIDVIFQSIEKETLESVFENWEERLDECVKAKGALVRDT
jgi:hypothetical protein